MDMSDYCKVEKSHKLSSYEVKFPIWYGQKIIRKPFLQWADNQRLPWYEAYNATKHSRHEAFEQATFEHMTDAVAGLAVLIAAQFYTYDFSPRDTLLSVGHGDHNDGTDAIAGEYFRVKFPGNWLPDQRYNFDWQKLEALPDPFMNFSY